MKNISLTNIFRKNVIGSPILANCRTFYIKNSQFSRFSSSFLINSQNFKAFSTTFSDFLSPVVILSNAKLFEYKNELFGQLKIEKNAIFRKCRFWDCKNGCIRSSAVNSKIEVIECVFDECSNFEKKGGAILLKGGIFNLASSIFMKCFCSKPGSAIYLTNMETAKLKRSTFSSCFDEKEICNCIVHYDSTGGRIRNVNCSNSLSRETAGFYVRSNKVSMFTYFNAINLTGSMILAVNLNFPIKYGNIINCNAEMGLISAINRDAFITNFYFSNNDGFLVTPSTKVILIFTDCIFKDFSERPRGGNIAIRGKCLLSNSVMTPFKDTKTRKKREKSSWPSFLGVFFIITFIVFISFYLFFYLNLNVNTNETNNNQSHNNNAYKKNPNTKGSGVYRR